MECLESTLQEEQEKANKYNPAIHIAINLAQHTLIKYYNLTDAADPYHILLGLSDMVC